MQLCYGFCTMDSVHIEQVAVQAARLVGERIKNSSGGTDFKVSDKARGDLVTEIDVWSEEQIRKQVSAAFPGHTIIGEETSAELVRTSGKSLEEHSRNGICWVIDPLDGTANFVSGIPHSAVSIGVLSDGLPLVGVVYDPHRDEMFTARTGCGAFLNGQPIHVRNTTSPSHSIMITGYTANRHETWELIKHAHDAFIRNCRRVRILGAAAIDQCWVACGRADAFFEYDIKSWDIAAGAIIAMEAGAICGCIVEPKQPFTIFPKSHLVAGPSLFPLLQDIGHEADREGRADTRQTAARSPRCG